MLTELRYPLRSPSAPAIVGNILTKFAVRFCRLLLIAVLLGFSVQCTMSARAETAAALSVSMVGEGEPISMPEPEEHGLSQQAVEVARLFGVPITNSMVVSWIVALGLIVFARIATRHMKQVPDGTQNLFEWLVESLYNFLGGLLGE